MWISHLNVFSNNFSHGIQKYEPVILHGRTAQEVPSQQLGPIKNYDVVSSLTGPHGGLVSVNQTEKHLSANDPEINFIDNLEDESGKLSLVELMSAIGHANFLKIVYHVLNICLLSFCCKFNNIS